MPSTNLPDSTKFFRYVVDSFDIIFPGEKEPLKLTYDEITGMTVEHDYDANFFPIFRVSIILNPEVYYKIIKTKLEVKFRIRLQVSAYKYNQEVLKRDVLNDIFCVYLDENTPFLDEAMQKKSKAVEDATANRLLKDFRTEYTFFLFKEKDLDGTKQITNKILKDTTVTNCLTYLLSTNGFKKVLMAPIKNKTVYKEILLLPIPLIGNILYIEQQYGLYSSGTNLYFDFNYVYLLQKSAKCEAWMPNENKQTVFMIKESVNVNALSSGSVDDVETKKFYINIGLGDYSATNQTVVNDQIYGNNLIVINPITADVKKLETKSIQRGAGTYKVVINKYNNQIMNESEMANRNELSKVVSLNMSDIDISALTPNKEFMCIFDNKNINIDYGGIYRMSKNFIEFRKEGVYFHTVANCQLRKQTY